MIYDLNAKFIKTIQESPMLDWCIETITTFNNGFVVGGYGPKIIIYENIDEELNFKIKLEIKCNLFSNTTICSSDIYYDKSDYMVFITDNNQLL